jgi:4-hydroxybenzoate polyprenyltransferase
MSEEALPKPSVLSHAKLFLGACRFHIVLVALFGTLTFSWWLTGIHLWQVAFISAIDWWILDVLNKIGDLKEDLHNNPTEARWVQHHGVGLTWICTLAFALSLVWSITVLPELTWARLAFQLLGIAYSFDVIYMPKALRREDGRRFSRFKVMYVFKNMSAEWLFLLSVVGYPLLAWTGPTILTTTQILLMCGFFYFLEMSFEILYDFKDIEGDRKEGVRTYPVVHGEGIARRIFDACLVLSAGFILIGYFWFGFDSRHIVVCFAPLTQAIAFDLYAKRGYPRVGSVWITHLCTVQLLVYNTYVWLELPWL